MVPQPGGGPARSAWSSATCERTARSSGSGAGRWSCATSAASSPATWAPARTRSSARPWTARSRRPRSASPTPSRRRRSAWRWSDSTARSCASTAPCPRSSATSPLELLELTFQDITHPDDLEADLQLVREVIAGERRNYRMEKRYIRSDRAECWVLLSVSLVRDDAGEPLYFVSQIEDITERRRSEDALLEAEDRFRSAFDEAPIGMAMRAPDGRFLRVNRALCEITGLLARATRGHHLPVDHPPRRPGPRREGLPRGDVGTRVPLPHREALHPRRRSRRAGGPERHGRPRRRRRAGPRAHPGAGHHRAQALRGPAPVPGRPRLPDRAVQPPPLRGGADPRAGQRRALREQGRRAGDRPRRLQVHQRLARPLDRRRADHARGPGGAQPAAAHRRARPPRRRRVRRDPAAHRRRRRDGGGRRPARGGRRGRPGRARRPRRGQGLRQHRHRDVPRGLAS